MTHNILKILILSLLFYSCKDNTIDKKETNSSFNNIDIPFNKPVDLLKIFEKSNQYVLMATEKEDTLEIVSEGEFIINPLNSKPILDSIQNKNNRIFKISVSNIDSLGSKNINLKFLNSNINIVEYSEKRFPKNAEQLAEYHNSKPALNEIESADINDAEIVLNFGLKIGSNRNYFFEKVMTINNQLDYFDKFNYVHIYYVMDDEIPDILLKYKNDSLINIKINTSSWPPLRKD